MTEWLNWKSEIESRLVMFDFLRPHGLYSPWNSPGQNTGVGSLSLLQRIYPTPEIKPRSPALQVDSLPAEPPAKPKNTGVGNLSLLHQIFLTQEWTGVSCIQTELNWIEPIIIFNVIIMQFLQTTLNKLGEGHD